MSTLIPSGGCIHLYPASHETPGPQWHEDDQHVTIGLFDTSTAPTIDSSGFIVINLLDVGPRRVVMMAANPDETLTARFISGGASNGGPIMRIRVTHKDIGPLDLNRLDHWAIVAGNFCNFWPEAEHLAEADISPADLRLLRSNPSE